MSNLMQVQPPDPHKNRAQCPQGLVRYLLNGYAIKDSTAKGLSVVN